MRQVKNKKSHHAKSRAPSAVSMLGVIVVLSPVRDADQNIFSRYQFTNVVIENLICRLKDISVIEAGEE